MPVSVNDKRQEWLRENAPRPESLKTIKTGSKLRVVMDTGNEHFGQFYKIHAMDTPCGTRYWYEYYGAVLDQDKKAQLAEGFNMFLKAQRLAQGPMNNLTSETNNLKIEAPTDPKKTDDHVDVPVVLYSKDSQQPSQFTAQASFVKNGFLFDWKEQLSPHVIEGQTATFERWMGDGTFASPREQLEWVPRGQVIVYKVTGVIHCPDIAQFASGRSHSPPGMFFPSPPPSSPARNSRAATSKASRLAKSNSQNRLLVSQERRPRKRARNSSPIEDVVRKEEIIDFVSDVDEVPQVAATYDGKGKSRAPNLGDIIELSD